jgi:hypothetical protein
MKHKIRQQILCFMINRFNTHDFIENQAKLDFFDNFVTTFLICLNAPLSLDPRYYLKKLTCCISAKRLTIHQRFKVIIIPLAPKNASLYVLGSKIYMLHPVYSNDWHSLVAALYQYLRTLLSQFPTRRGCVQIVSKYFFFFLNFVFENGFLRILGQQTP